MFFSEYNQIVQFASQGKFENEIGIARKEFIARTGDLFESDESYERRLSVFLEWYTLDRPTSFSPNRTPIELYLESITENTTTTELTHLRQLTKTVHSVFEFKKSKPEQLHVVDVLTKKKYKVFERRKPAGIEAGDLFEARLVPWDDNTLLSPAVTIHPRDARKTILKAAKCFQSGPEGVSTFDWVHRIAYFTNRCARYKHVSALEVFSELN